MENNVWDDPVLTAGLEAANVINQFAANEGNYKQTKQTNKTNLAINSANIAANKELLEMQQAYNSPQNQRAMLQAAGYSPAALLGSSGFHSTSSATSVPSPIRAESAKFNPVQVGGGLMRAQQLREIAASAEKQKNDAALSAIDSATRDMKNRRDILETQSRARRNDAEAQAQEFENERTEINYSAFVNEQHQEYLKKQYEADRANVELSRANLEYLLQQKYGDKEYKAKINALVKQAEYALAKIQTEREQQAYLRALARGASLDADTTEAYLNYFNDVKDFRKAQEQRDGFQAQQQNKYDRDTLLDRLYMQYEKERISVSEAQTTYNMLNEQYKLAVINNNFAEIESIGRVLNVYGSAIKSARDGMITPRDKARIDLESRKLDLQRDKFDFERTRQKRKFHKNLINGDWYETERFEQ